MVLDAAKRRALRRSQETAERLIEAATAEFCEHGFLGTDTNKIARRAGFAPQTFYRWFDDKTQIFIEVYDRWIGGEFASAQELIDAQADDGELIESSIAYHRDYRIFRRSLRQLAVENPRVRASRARSRRDQIQRLRVWTDNPALSDGDIAVFLLEHERLCDAIAEQEFEDLGLTEAPIRARLADLYREVRPAGSSIGRAS